MCHLTELSQAPLEVHAILTPLRRNKEMETEREPVTPQTAPDTPSCRLPGFLGGHALHLGECSSLWTSAEAGVQVSRLLWVSF